MDKILSNLLKMDTKVQRFGCGLNPRLRAAITADLRFPARAAVPPPRPQDMAGPLPENVTRLADYLPEPDRKKA